MKSIIAFIILASSLNALAAKVEFPENRSCVAWKAKKKMWLVSTVEPIGINCDIKAEISDPLINRHTITVTIPLDKFNSQEPERDKEVADRYLKSKIQPALEFKTPELNNADLQKIMTGETKEIAGKLKIAGTSFDITFDLAVTSTEGGYNIGLSTRTAFSKLAVERPKIAGGLMANTLDQLELSGVIKTQDIEGYSKLALK